jgi:hypothetical protein
VIGKVQKTDRHPTLTRPIRSVGQLSIHASFLPSNPKYIQEREEEEMRLAIQCVSLKMCSGAEG